MTTTYATLADALEVAADNTDASKELARSGPGYVMVAEVGHAAGDYVLRAVTVHSELDWNTTPNRHVVKRVDGRTCPVCGKTMTAAGEWRGSNAGGPLVGGLDPASCVGCHDTMTTYGIVPFELADGSSTAIPRPE